jgi:hypothetical protein
VFGVQFGIGVVIVTPRHDATLKLSKGDILRKDRIGCERRAEVDRNRDESLALQSKHRASTRCGVGNCASSMPNFSAFKHL